MKIKADLHNHFSTFENIGNVFNQAIDIAQKNLGADGIFGVINAQDKRIGRYETFLRQGGSKVEDLENAFYVPSKNIYVIKGQEVFTQGGHILVLGLNQGIRLQDYRTLEDSLKEAEDNHGVIIADHGFFLDGIFTKQRPDKHLKYLDGIEIHSGEAWLPHPRYYPANKKAQEFYNKIKYFYDIGAISTSDGHSVNEIGMSYTFLEKPDFSSPERLIESLRKSIREHKDFSQDKQTNAYLGTLNHAGKIVVARLASKLGLIGRIN
jgi:hypothetical protein